MDKLTVNSNGMLNNAQEVIEHLTSRYKSYLEDLFAQKAVEDLSMNEMAFIRLVSSSSILSMKKSGNTMLEILNKPVSKPSIAPSKPITTQSAMDFIKSLPQYKQDEFLAMLKASRDE